MAEVFADWIGKLEHAVAKAQASGQIRLDRPASELAEFIVAVLEGGIMQSRLLKKEGPMARCLDTLRTVLELRV